MKKKNQPLNRFRFNDHGSASKAGGTAIPPAELSIASIDSARDPEIPRRPIRARLSDLNVPARAGIDNILQ